MSGISIFVYVCMHVCGCLCRTLLHQNVHNFLVSQRAVVIVYDFSVYRHDDILSAHARLTECIMMACQLPFMDYRYRLFRSVLMWFEKQRVE